MDRGSLKRTTMYLGDEQRDHLERISNRTGMPVAEVTRRALDFFLATEDRFRRMGLQMGDLDGLLEAVRKEEREKRPSDLSSMAQMLALILAKLDQIAPDAADVK